MTNKQTDNLVPKLRFLEFNNKEEWERKTIEEILTVNSGRDYKHLQPGNIPVYGTGGYMLSVNDKLSDVDAIGIGRKGTIDKPQYLKAPFWTVDTLFYLTKKYDYNLKFLFYLLQTIEWKKYSEQTGVPSLTRASIEGIEVKVPRSLEEQQKIADCLFSIDSYISSINEKIEQLKAHKKSLLQKLFPQNGKTVPEYRFPEFRDSEDWEKRILDDVTVVVNRRNKSNRHLPIYSISNNDGFVPQSEQFEGLDSKKRGYDISLYKIVGRNTFAYNPARINIGSIGYSGDLKEVLISSLYVCFKTTDELDDEFLRCFLNTSQFGQAVENNVEGGIRSYLFYENFSRIKISFPSIREQKKIASAIMSMEELIACCQKKALLLEDHKRGLMQLLFPSTK